MRSAPLSASGINPSLCVAHTVAIKKDCSRLMNITPTKTFDEYAFMNNEKLPNRKSTRKKHYDYSSNGSYFITICTEERKNILSSIVGDGSSVPQLTYIGQTAEGYISRIPVRYRNITVDKYVIMPNHIHLILTIRNPGGTEDPSPTISRIIAWVKYGITKHINEINSAHKIFQRSFHDHIIRNKADYDMIWKYIENNPKTWKKDCFYP